MLATGTEALALVLAVRSTSDGRTRAMRDAIILCLPQSSRRCADVPLSPDTRQRVRVELIVSVLSESSTNFSPRMARTRLVLPVPN